MSSGARSRRGGGSWPRTFRCCWSGCSSCSSRRCPTARRVLVDATLGLGGHADALLVRAPRADPGRPGPRPRARSPAPASGWPATATGSTSCTPSTTSCPTCWPSSGTARPAGRRRADGPRRVLDAARRGRARLRLLAGRAAGHADGPDRGADRGRGAQHLPGRASSRGSCASTARSGSRGGSPSAVVAARAQEPFTDSGRLVELLYDAVPAARRRTGGHPAKRTFQALRIEVNGELDALRPARARGAGGAAGGRPDRRRGLPVAGGPAGQAGAGGAREVADAAGRAGRAAGTRSAAAPADRGAEQADEQETEHNPRAASVRLRAAERILEAAA